MTDPAETEEHLFRTVIYPLLSRWARRVNVHPADRDDAIQDAALAVLEGLRRWPDVAGVPAWIVGVARNVRARQALLAVRRKRDAVPSDGGLAAGQEPGAEVEAGGLSFLRLAAALAALASRPPSRGLPGGGRRDFVILEAVFRNGGSWVEAARELGVPRQRVEKVLHRMRPALLAAVELAVLP